MNRLLRPLRYALLSVATMASLLPVLVHAAAAAEAGPVPEAACSELAKLALPNTTITKAELVAAAAFQMPNAAGPFSQPGLNLAGEAQLGPNPAFCRIAATLKPSADSDIKIEVWLPRSGWNKKFLGVANFGWAGSLLYAGMLTGIERGYASASTDTGHDGSGADGNGGRFALGHPEKIIDYAYRATHEMTVVSKALIKAYYGVGAERAYMAGCSLGGLEGLIEAKRYPKDYDGIVVGAPPNPLTNFNAAQLWPSWLINQDPSRLIPKEKYAMVHQAVLKACASPLGRKDGIVDEPDRCTFDPAQLTCKGADTADCLTSAQVFLLQQTYAGPSNPRTHQIIFPGQARGSELQMQIFASGRPFPVALDLFRYVAFQNADWDSSKMDWDKDVDAAIRKVGPLMHVDADLKPFFDHGGKLLFYIGWNDGHNPEQLIEYYKAVVKSSGAAPDKSPVRLFIIPGMNHCFGGEGCDTFNKLGALDGWIAQGIAPERIIASKIVDGKVVRTRPLCAYPQVANYKGSGSTDDADYFACSAE